MGINPDLENGSMKRFTLVWGSHRLVIGPRTLIMGVLNVTPDSFSDGGRFDTVERAVIQAEKLVADGADIIDIGGESTRPFSDPISGNEETRRIAPVIERIADRLRVPISIDTTKAEVARQALNAGACIINDISAMRMDPSMGSLAAKAGVPLILMHMQGTPKNMQEIPRYDDLMGEIIGFLKDAMDRALAAGVTRDRIIIDPGIGFGKTYGHNLTLINRLSALKALDAPILVGPSRKAFIRHTLKKPDQDDLAPSHPDVTIGTQAVVAGAILNGAHLVRVHDVAETRVTVKMIDAIRCETP